MEITSNKMVDHGDGEKTAGLEKIDQEKELAPIFSRDDVTEPHEAGAAVQVHVTPQHCDTLPRDDLLPGAIEKDIGRCEASSLAPVSADNLQTTELATYQENQVEASSGGPATKLNEINGVPENEMGEKIVEDVGKENTETNNLESNPASQMEVNGGLKTGLVLEKKRKRTETSKDDINQSVADATTTSREINEAAGNVDRVDATSGSLEISERGNLGNAIPNAMQKENEMGEKIDDDTENQQAGSGLISSTSTEKKKKQKKSSKDHINQSTTIATTVSREGVNEREKVSDHVDTTSEKLVNALKEPIQNENELGDEAKSVKSTKKIKSRKNKTPTGAEDIVQVVDLATTMPALVQESKTLDNIGITDDKRTLEHEVVKDSGEIDADAAKSAKKKKSRKTKTSHEEVCDADESKSVKSTKKKMSRKTKTPIGADEIQAEDNVQVTGLATTEIEVAKDNGQVDANEAKSVLKSTKKKKSRKTTSAAEEDTLVDSGPQCVEPLKVVDGEGPDSVIRNVLDSLRQRNETEERLDQIEKKASKKSKKSLSSNMVDSQVLSVEVNNAVQEAVPPINNPKNTDASWTSVKKNTKSDVSRLKKRTEAADNNEDPYLSHQTQREKADMGDNFGCRQKDDIVVGGKKQDKVAGGAKSKKEKKSLSMRHAGSIDGSLSSMEPKEENSRGKPASSGTSDRV